MSDYKLYLLDKAGRIYHSLPLDCGSDEEATALAGNVCLDQTREVWQSGRKVCALEPASIAQAPHASDPHSPPPLFDYEAVAELFIGSRHGKSKAMDYKRFVMASDAIRYAIEDMTGDVLKRTVMQIDADRYGSSDIRSLYDDMRYPLSRRAPAASP